MQITHKITPDIEGAGSPIYVVYDAPQNCDISQLIHDAALDYRLAMPVDDDAVGGMSYAEFVSDVPNEFCEKNGFKKLVLDDTAQTIPGRNLCLTSHEVRRQLADRQKAIRRNAALHKAFSAFGRRMEPALRKSTAMSGWTFHQITKQMLLWAEEFAGTGADPYGHFERSFVDDKLNHLRRAETMEPPKENSAE